MTYAQLKTRSDPPTMKTRKSRGADDEVCWTWMIGVGTHGFVYTSMGCTILSPQGPPSFARNLRSRPIILDDDDDDDEEEERDTDTSSQDDTHDTANKVCEMCDDSQHCRGHKNTYTRTSTQRKRGSDRNTFAAGVRGCPSAGVHHPQTPYTPYTTTRHRPSASTWTLAAPPSRYGVYYRECII